MTEIILSDHFADIGCVKCEEQRSQHRTVLLLLLLLLLLLQLFTAIITAIIIAIIIAFLFSRPRAQSLQAKNSLIGKLLPRLATVVKSIN